MNIAATCSHCLLPIGRLGQTREVNGATHAFCCYGCCLAYQVHHGEKDEPEAAALLIRLGVGGFLAMNIMLFSLLLYSGTFRVADGWLANPIHWLLWILATPLLVMLGGPFIRAAWQAARQGQVTTDTLVSIGALAAYGYSAYQVVLGSGMVYFDTATMILVLFTLGRYLEAQGRVRAARSLAPMLAAERAEVRIVADGKDTTQPVSVVQPGAIARVLPGERIAVDGIVVEGHSHCDEAILTGQPGMQPKAPGARIHAGSINGVGQLLIRVTAAGTNTTWVRISRLVRAALARKSLTGEMVDRVAAVFVPFVLLLAAGSFWFWSGRVPFDQALLTALAVLVVACPCSLGLAAPLAMTLGIGQAAQRGILIRGGGVLEKLARVRAIAFDKTGTLTEGKPEFVSTTVDDATEHEVLQRALALALASEHPLARAIARARATRTLVRPMASNVQAHPGAGITGSIEGEFCVMGSGAFMTSLGWTIGRELTVAGAEANTVVYVGWRGRARGCIALADKTRPEARAVVAALRARGFNTLLLSGDREKAVAQAAHALNIAAWRSELLPDGKVQALQEWTEQLGPVAMVGDGLNDGPVLSAASVGIAVGGATDLARESADATLPEGALTSLPWLMELAARVHRSVLTNLAWALGYNAIALSLAVAGLLQPVIAAGLMAGSSLLVVVRSLRANRVSGATEPRAASSTDASALFRT
jgi:Cu2+-exporting ATPase